MKNSQLKQWCELGLEQCLVIMLDLAKNDNLIVLSADLEDSGLDRFKKEHPDKYISIGRPEQINCSRVSCKTRS